MKKKFCFCYCPSVVETEDSSDLLLSSSSSKNFTKKTEEKTLSSLTKSKPSFNKSIHKLPSRKIFSYKNFPRLFKAILFHDPLRNIQQLEIELKSKVNWNKDGKCFKKLENHESSKPEMEVEEVNKISEDQKESSVSHESEKLSSSNWINPKSSSTTSTSSCDQKKKDYCSLLYLIVIALFMTIFLGKYWAIVSTLSWLYSIPYYRSQQ